MNIYICGKAGAGKSITAAYLKDKYGMVTAKFAYPVYELAYNYFSMKGKDRRLLQVLGSDVARNTINSNIWVNRFKEDIQIVEGTRKVLQLPPVNFILDDCRFENEHKILKEMGWVGLYLDVPDYIRVERLQNRDGTAQEATLNHPSELAVDTFKHELVQINASVPLLEMYAQIEKIICP